MAQITVMVTAGEGGAVLAATLKALLKQSMGDYEILVANLPQSDPLVDSLMDPRIHFLNEEFRNAAQFYQYAWLEYPADFLLLVPEGVEAEFEMLETLVIEFKLQKRAVGLYSTYLLETGGQVEKIVPFYYSGDLTERQDLGPVLALRTAMIKRAGGFEVSLNSAHLYDLRLRLLELGDYGLVKTPLYRVKRQSRNTENTLGATRIFSPGVGNRGGFSYLYYTPAENSEFELAFKNFLHRRGAYLVPEPRPVEPVSDYSCDVSVVIPVFNREGFIGKAIESVQRGTFADWEIIVVDNGSTDGTREVVRELARNDQRIRLVENRENIIALSLNLGITQARGKYIAQLDSGDEYAPTALEDAVEYLDEHVTCALAISYYDLMDEEGNILEDMGVVKHLEFDPNNHLRVDGAGAMRIWHRSVLLEMGLFDVEHYGHFGEDYHMVTMVAEKYLVGRIPKTLYHYRRHPGNTDVQRSEEMKIANKTRARWEAIARRSKLNGNG